MSIDYPNQEILPDEIPNNELPDIFNEGEIPSPIDSRRIQWIQKLKTSQVEFVVAGTDNIIATINASVEGLNIDADKINISGSTTFASGYNPSEKLDLLGGSYDSAASGARVRIFPDADTDANTGIQITDDVGNDVFKAIVGGVDIGDVILGDEASNKYLKWDKSEGILNFGSAAKIDGRIASTISEAINVSGEATALLDGIVTEQKLANAAVTFDKINKWFAGKMGTSFPASPSNGELFLRTDQNRFYRYSSSEANWISVDYHDDSTRFADGVIKNALIESLNAGKITTGYLAAARLDTAVAYISQSAMISEAVINNAHINNLAANKIIAGTGIVNALEIKNSLTTASGGCIKQGQTAFGTGTGFWIGDVSGIPKFSIGSSSKYFKFDGTNISWKAQNTELDTSGNLTASSANISGIIKATSGYIGGTSSGWEVSSGYLKSTSGDIELKGTDTSHIKAISGTNYIQLTTQGSVPRLDVYKNNILRTTLRDEYLGFWADDGTESLEIIGDHQNTASFYGPNISAFQIRLGNPIGYLVLSYIESATGPYTVGSMQVGADINRNSLARIVLVADSVIPDGISVNLGNTSYYWSKVVGNYGDFNYLRTRNGTEWIDTSSTDSKLKQNLICYTNEGKNLGDSTHRFASVFGKYLRGDSLRNNAGTNFIDLTGGNVDLYAPLILNQRSSNPSAVNGMMYYYSSGGVYQIRCCVGGTWYSINLTAV